MRHALIIEDEFLIALMIEDQLGELGFDSVDMARGELQAIELAATRCPDLITADEKRESGSGVAAIRHICRD